MRRPSDMDEFRFYVLVAVDVTVGDRDAIVNELRRQGVGGPVSAVLERCKVKRFVERDGDGRYRLTDKGRRAARAELDRLRQVVDYGAKGLR